MPTMTLIIAKAYDILGLLRRSYSLQSHTNSKKQLYISPYCIAQFYENCTILNTFKNLNEYNGEPPNTDFTSDYKSQLIQTQLLPLTYILDLNDVMFFIKSLKTTTMASTLH